VRHAARQPSHGFHFLRLEKLAFQPLAVADVVDEGNRKQALGGLDVAEADLDRKLGSVFPAASKVHPDAHRPHPRPCEVLFAVASMSPPLGLGKQNLDPRAEQFLAAITEHFLGLGIGEHDAAVPVDAQNRLRRRFQQRHDHLFAFVQESDWVPALASRASRKI
jgi:hypothetical protein